MNLKTRQMILGIFFSLTVLVFSTKATFWYDWVMVIVVQGLISWIFFVPSLEPDVPGEMRIRHYFESLNINQNTYINKVKK